LVSEGLDANYRDIVNYAIFALIKLGDWEIGKFFLWAWVLFGFEAGLSYGFC
jgi:hypothetical protein